MREIHLSSRFSAMSRRKLLLAGAACAGIRLSSADASVIVCRPFGSDAPTSRMALSDFAAGTPGDGENARTITSIIGHNLRRSGLSAPIDPHVFSERPADIDAPPRFPEWRARDVEALATGRVTRQSDGRLKIDFRLWNVFDGVLLDRKEYVLPQENLRRTGHTISDAIYERLTGEKGYFDSRVAFIDETGPTERRIKRLAVMDQDGANIRYVTHGEELMFTPRFSPSGRHIAYTSAGRDGTRVYVLDIESGQREIVGDFPGDTFSPRFSPDGETLIMSVVRGDDGSVNLFAMNLISKAITDLTSGPSIDTAPSYSPDGRQICFESDRDGRRQIYMMSASGGVARRISLGKWDYSAPVWSPKGDVIAFVMLVNGQSMIGIMGKDGSNECAVTRGFPNESPTFAPNGRALMFFRDAGGASGPSLFTIDLNGRNEFMAETPNYASDPDWSVQSP
jgi:TolB protein